MTKPPLDLSVNIETTAGGQYRWDGQSKDARNVPQGLTFSTSRGDGFASGSVTLSRRVDRDYVDLGLYDDITIVGADGSVAYEGRVGAMPRSMDSTHSVTVQMAGWMSHAKDRKFREIYVDRDLSRWGGPSIARQTSVLPTRTYGTTATAPDEGLASLSQTFTGPWPSSPLPFCEGWYDAAGIPLGSLYYAWRLGTNVNSADTNFVVRARLVSGDDTATAAYDDTDQMLAAGPVTGTLDATSDRTHGLVQFYYNTGPAGGDDATYALTWTCLAVYGNHGLTKHGAADATTAQGFYASDVIKDIASRFCTKLNTDGVQDTTYPIAHLAFLDPTFPHDAFLEVNKYHLWNLAVWENKTLHFTPTDLTDYDWEIRLSDPGVSVDLQGDSTENLANGICVTYQDAPSGKTKRLTPDDYPDELADLSVSNPANKAGLTVWTEIQLSSPSTEDDALQIGRMALAEYNQPQGSGTIKIRGHVRDKAGHWAPVWKVRAGDRVIISDHPNDRVRQIVETNYDHGSYTNTLAIDATFKTLDAILDRFGAAISIGTLAP